MEIEETPGTGRQGEQIVFQFLEKCNEAHNMLLGSIKQRLEMDDEVSEEYVAILADAIKYCTKGFVFRNFEKPFLISYIETIKSAELVKTLAVHTRKPPKRKNKVVVFVEEQEAWLYLSLQTHVIACLFVLTIPEIVGQLKRGVIQIPALISVLLRNNTTLSRELHEKLPSVYGSKLQMAVTKELNLDVLTELTQALEFRDSQLTEQPGNRSPLAWTICQNTSERTRLFSGQGLFFVRSAAYVLTSHALNNTNLEICNDKWTWLCVFGALLGESNFISQQPQWFYQFLEHKDNRKFYHKLASYNRVLRDYCFNKGVTKGVSGLDFLSDAFHGMEHIVSNIWGKERPMVSIRKTRLVQFDELCGIMEETDMQLQMEQAGAMYSSLMKNHTSEKQPVVCLNIPCTRIEMEVSIRHIANYFGLMDTFDEFFIVSFQDECVMIIETQKWILLNYAYFTYEFTHKHRRSQKISYVYTLMQMYFGCFDKQLINTECINIIHWFANICIAHMLGTPVGFESRNYPHERLASPQSHEFDYYLKLLPILAKYEEFSTLEDDIRTGLVDSSKELDNTSFSCPEMPNVLHALNSFYDTNDTVKYMMSGTHAALWAYVSEQPDILTEPEFFPAVECLKRMASHYNTGEHDIELKCSGNLTALKSLYHLAGNLPPLYCRMIFQGLYCKRLYRLPEKICGLSAYSKHVGGKQKNRFVKKYGVETYIESAAGYGDKTPVGAKQLFWLLSILEYLRFFEKRKTFTSKRWQCENRVLKRTIHRNKSRFCYTPCGNTRAKAIVKKNLHGKESRVCANCDSKLNAKGHEYFTEVCSDGKVRWAKTQSARTYRGEVDSLQSPFLHNNEWDVVFKMDVGFPLACPHGNSGEYLHSTDQILMFDSIMGFDQTMKVEGPYHDEILSSPFHGAHLFVAFVLVESIANRHNSDSNSFARQMEELGYGEGSQEFVENFIFREPDYFSDDEYCKQQEELSMHFEGFGQGLNEYGKRKLTTDTTPDEGAWDPGFGMGYGNFGESLDPEMVQGLRKKLKTEEE